MLKLFARASGRRSGRLLHREKELQDGTEEEHGAVDGERHDWGENDADGVNGADREHA
jgi:hypothetical protein